ncbi:hypothetical protein [Nostoc sp. DSM 114167]
MLILAALPIFLEKYLDKSDRFTDWHHWKRSREVYELNYEQLYI